MVPHMLSYNSLVHAPPLLLCTGSGEVFAELKRSGVLRAMRGRGIRHVEVNAVDDNVLARPADPLLIGFAMDKGLDAAAKVRQQNTTSCNSPQQLQAPHACPLALSQPLLFLHTAVSAGGGAIVCVSSLRGRHASSSRQQR